MEPRGSLTYKAQFIRQTQVIQLDHHPIDVKRYFVALLQPAAGAGYHFFQIFTTL